MINVQGIRRNVKNAVRNYTDAEVKVREATSNDPWGPSSTLMSEIADLTYNVVAFSEIMKMVWKRLNDHGKNWRHVYKALVLLEYLIKTGSEKVAQQCRENIFSIQTLKDFQYIEENKDQGMNVREKSKLLVALLKDNERLSNERARALKAKERLVQSSSHSGSLDADMCVSSSGRDSFGSPDGAMSPGEFPGHVTSSSELENARPQTSGEEELQLQLALAMSKEEADQEERMRQNDELRLKMALTESEVSYSHTDNTQSSNTFTTVTSDQSVMDDLLGLQLGNESEGTSFEKPETTDPWGMPRTIQPSQIADPWGLPTTQPLVDTVNDPWRLPVCSALHTNKVPVPTNTPATANDPWGGTPVVLSAATNSWGSQPVISDPFDIFAPAPPQRSKSSLGELEDFELRKQTSEIRGSHYSDLEQQKVKEARRTPESFLGPNANLVNLDSLVITKQMDQASSTATNPFAGQTYSNPFEALRAPPPTINQLRIQQPRFASELTGPTNSQSVLPLDGLASSSPWTPTNNPFM
ncbi:epsin-2-like isoform X2 [Limulus polyphemus]|uniref:Epsin-2-like isoform X2 n=1 Tax=Limulus polyphemus TaxID=6850 RepID=A0ABM1T2N4_LIMPO|nr:epsin-2-like isoform X2 [Limulus polyphemus]